MDKRSVLINRLHEQYSQGADDSSLLTTALLLVTELQQNETAKPPASFGNISVILPIKPFAVNDNEPIDWEKSNVAEEKENMVEEEIKPQPDEALHEVIENNILPQSFIEPYREPVVEPPVQQDEEPQLHTSATQTSSVNTLAEEKYNDVIDEVPTLAHQQPKVIYDLNDSLQTSTSPSLNDMLKEPQGDGGGRVQTEPIRDLRKAIGINDKYTFIRELFRNDEAAYDRSIKTINGFSILPEAEYWIQREMKYKLGWDDNNATVKAFYQLVKRRFS